MSLLLCGGELADGAVPPRSADVLVEGGRVAAVAPSGLSADRFTGSTSIDVTGLTLVPGFIDTHVHGEGPLLRDGVVLPALRQGVTTLVLGQDGCGVAPGGPATVAYMRGYFAAVNGDLPVSGGVAVADLLAAFDQRCAQNVA